VSTDDHKTQCEFAESLKVLFPMVGDKDGSISRQYDVFWPFIKMVRRVTFVIDPEGTIRGVFQHEFAIGKHVDEAVAAVERLMKKFGGRAASSAS